MFSEDEKNFIYNAFEDNQKRDEAFVAIMHNHGTIVADKEPNQAFVLFNAVEANSKYIYEGEMLSLVLQIKDLVKKLNKA